ncbi:hypothetical protein L2E82_36265 [Cichorium intybus]|uniref:Uncharacterized protein n=1 Tax=Cichorium intybus TaxID=13427 RepID=A0ACB9BR13_CICIN|nr:hypothetical protein L2E82_36265 [Cichorium intybus]
MGRAKVAPNTSQNRGSLNEMVTKLQPHKSVMGTLSTEVLAVLVLEHRHEVWRGIAEDEGGQDRPPVIKGKNLRQRRKIMLLDLDVLEISPTDG